MDVEKVKVLVALKCGLKTYKKGMIYSEPIPDDLIQEIRRNTGTVEVLSRRGSTAPDESQVKQEAPVEKDKVEPPVEKDKEANTDEKVSTVEEPKKPKRTQGKRVVSQKRKSVTRNTKV